jgi:ATP-dependent DNA ligase
VSKSALRSARCHRRAAESYAPNSLGLEGIVSKRKDSAYRSGRSADWLKMKNSDAPAVKREAEEDWS